MSVDSEMEDDRRLDAEETTPRTVSPQMVTTEALQNIVDNWKTKFQILSDGIRAAQVAAETCSANIEDLHRDSRKREEAQERRIQEMQIGLARFLDRCDPAHLAASACTFDSSCAPVMSTPVTQPGAPSRRRPDGVHTSTTNLPSTHARGRSRE